MAQHTREELAMKQALPLDVKIKMTETRIKDWVDVYGLDGVYISFSGGKDSTVLLTIARNMFPTIKAVFCDTGLEYPEIRDFVKTFSNVDWLKPKLTFKQTIEKFGYPIISKEISGKIYECRSAMSKSKDSYVLHQMNGTYKSKNGKTNMIDVQRYKFLLNAPFKISKSCCNIMKKNPAHQYNVKTGRKPIIATMACESMLRTQHWLRDGCNSFKGKNPASKPMSFWTEQDVLTYIQKYAVPICSVYGDIVIDYKTEGTCNGQLAIFNERPLTTTGAKRTGCMYCAYGCHLEQEGNGRFELMKQTHPKQYEYIMKPWCEGGLDYKNVIDWLNEHGDMNIKY